MELLWPRVGPALASNRLSVLLSAVRDALQPHPAGEGPSDTSGGAVSLKRAQVSVDVEDFLARAIAALDADRTQQPDAIGRLVAAVAAHTGDFLEDDPYQEWAGALAKKSWPLTSRSFGHCLNSCTTLAIPAVWYTLRLLEQDHYDEEANLSLVGVPARRRPFR